MALIYEEDKPYTGPPIRYHSLDANKLYLKHYSNLLYLKFIANKSNDFREAQQARKEIGIAERKMGYMEKHPNFSWAIVRPEAEKLNQQWR